MTRLYLTRLVLPLVFVAGMVALPFLWLPNLGPQKQGTPVSSEAPSAAASRPASTPGGRSPFQRAMTVGFALILVSVTIGGAMLYGITRRQTASWRRRFAPRRKGRGRSGKFRAPS